MPRVNYRHLLLVYLRILMRKRQRQRLLANQEEKKRSLPRFWIRPHLQKREELGAFHTLFQEYRVDDREYFFRFCRMSPESFDYLAYMAESKIKRKTTNFRKPISPEECFKYTTNINPKYHLNKCPKKSTVQKIYSSSSQNHKYFHNSK